MLDEIEYLEKEVLITIEQQKTLKTLFFSSPPNPLEAHRDRIYALESNIKRIEDPSIRAMLKLTIHECELNKWVLDEANTLPCAIL